MLQEVMTKPGEIIFKEVEIPSINENQVLVKIMNIGICGSDIHVYHGKHPFTKYPVTQGHEVSGLIVKLGKNVKDLKLNEKVTIEPQVYCGKCYPCRHGKYNLCEELKVMGFQTVAVHACKQIDIKEKDVVVIGAGPIGNLIAQTAKGMSARKVLITDISDYRLQKALECGVDVAINTKEKDFNAAGITNVFVQDNQSKSKKGVLRGLHFQKKFPQAKLVRCIEGEVFDVCVDLRKDSPTYGKWEGVILSAEKGNQFMIPRGFAHGFVVLSETATFCYKCDELYHPEDEGGLMWNDPEIGIDWPFKGEILLSEKDKIHPSLKNLKIEF